MRNYFCLLMICPLLAAPKPASAGHSDSFPRVYAHALIVGSNRGGVGQQKLRYAHRDAKRVAEVLVQLGRYDRNHIDLLLDPSVQALKAHLDRLTAKLAAAASEGRQSTVVFYYSGHARAGSLNIGREDFALSALKKRLERLPAKLTVAILDACQTGAISRIKGAHPTADFSYNSVSEINTRGIAVMASSSATELSQESDTLSASYFTHHLIVGLRGAADKDTDGRVTLSEAYRYAYNRTLIATASTAVGKQHVTLETRLAGKGDTVLTYPAQASSSLVLEPSLVGEVLIHNKSDKSVVAELVKSKGHPLRLAFPPGHYIAHFRRRSNDVRRCVFHLRENQQTALQINRCQRVTLPSDSAKKGASWWRKRFALELSIGIGGNPTNNKLDRRLIEFGFENDHPVSGRGKLIRARAVVLYRLYSFFEFGFGWDLLDRERYTRDFASATTKYRWSGHALTFAFRGIWPLLDETLLPFAQFDIGPAWVKSVLSDPSESTALRDHQVDWGYRVAGSLGAILMPWERFGFMAQLQYSYAPVLKSEIGDRHDSGGVTVSAGLRGIL